ncbi:MAG: phenylalanine--tRNA ligase subunit alpha [Candidatus Aureabacteria bacterium]|nr:phenylalanine--tRNA ligase subunit alpha [Candidatus Auribacterota bacterium]
MKKQFSSDLAQAASDDLPQLKIKYLGRNGLITSLFNELGNATREEKPKLGKLLNELKNELSQTLETMQKTKVPGTNTASYDVTLPGRTHETGTLHPLTTVLQEICVFFENMGFTVAEGPDIESEYNNFTALNILNNHPARDMHDTFYLDSGGLLRTHTSPVQIRVMQNGKPPFRVIAPGKVYRCDSDLRHSPMFHQVEGFCVGEGIHFGHLKYLLKLFAKKIFGESVKLRFRPSFFPFTEPSAEVDISCVICRGKGCRTCSNSGWIEILGAGMIHPNVLHNVRLDPEHFSGYAFGMGVERIAMLKYGIGDIRLFFENNHDFLVQFK